MGGVPGGRVGRSGSALCGDNRAGAAPGAAPGRAEEPWLAPAGLLPGAAGLRRMSHA